MFLTNNSMSCKAMPRVSTKTFEKVYIYKKDGLHAFGKKKAARSSLFLLSKSMKNSEATCERIGF